MRLCSSMAGIQSIARDLTYTQLQPIKQGALVHTYWEL